MRTFLAALACLTLIAACDSEGPPPKIYGPQRDALEKAKGVDATVQQGAEQQRRAEEEQTR